MTQHKDMSNLAQIATAIDDIRREFITKLETYVENLADIHDRASLESEIETAIFIAHRIRGVAGTFGYTDLGQMAGDVESALAHVAANGFAQGDVASGLGKIHTLSEEIAKVCFDDRQSRVS